MAVTSRKLISIILSWTLTIPSLSGQQPGGQQSVKIETSEVLLDVVVVDKKGRPVRDLKAEEIEIFEDGVKQPLVKFSAVGSTASDARKEPASSNDGGKDGGKNAGALSISTASAPPPLNLVTIIVDHLPANRVQPVRDAAFNFVDNSVTSDMLVRVVVIGQKLYAIEQFTNDRAKLRKAVERATSTVEKSFAEISNRIAAELKSIVDAEPKSDAEVTPANPRALLAKLTLETLAGSERVSREGKSNLHAFSLLPFARAHRLAPGRKMALYFSDGLYMPSGMNELMRAAVSEANRANLSYYAINIRTLLSGTGNQSSRLETATVVNQTRRPETASYNGAVGDSFNTSDRVAGRGQITTNFNMFEVFDRNKELNKQGPLAELAEGTGGFLLTVSNDLNGALKRVGAELGNYYAISYIPTKQEYDGKFRAISVKILRPGLKAQTRSGYFALPPASDSRPVLSYETPLLEALNGAVVPRDFPFAAAALHFEARENEVHYAMLLDLPLAEFIHEENREKKAYPVDFSVMAMVKDEKGEVVQRFSEPRQMEIPAAMIEGARKSSFTLTRHFWLAPGRYTLEAVAHDQRSGKLSAQRQILTVAPPRSGLRTGNLFLVKQVEQIDGKANSDPDNPLIAQDRKIIPDVQTRIAAATRDDLSFHLSIFPEAKSAAKPSLKLELLHDGKVIAATSPQLPPADDRGRISFTAGIAASNFTPSNYRFHAIVKQADQSVEEIAEFTITGERKDAAVEEKTITSSLSASDKTRELALLALKTITPIEVSTSDLLKEVEQAGALMYTRLGEYTYSLRKVRRVLTPKGKIKSEEYQDYEAYPVKGKHALIQLAENGSRLSNIRIDLNRRSATNLLIKSEDEAQKLSGADREELNKRIGYWGASLEGNAQRRGQPRRNVFITIDPEAFFRACELSSPRSALLEGRETIVLDFRPRAGVQLDQDKDWIGRLTGTVWIDRADRTLVRIEGRTAPGGIEEPAPDGAPLNFVYQQQLLAAGVWGPSLIRINSAGDENLFRGLNWDAWFEFGNFKRFDSRDSDVKIVSPKENTTRQ